MFSVIFEVLPAEGKKDAYLDLAKHLKPILGIGRRLCRQ